ncbi:MAG: biopolymer transporter ExbD [Zoogloeaceae bacterium]|jgi:biopolymer transport protein ExbD|nr:biopolymer transporter ExbD [Zoogloeaceae bacterium]
MSIAIGAGDTPGDPDVMVEMNTTPLIDVMLVLLIMLIITIPIQLHSVHLDLPVGRATPPAIPPEIARIDIDATGLAHWNGEALADADALERRLSEAAAKAVAPELHLHPDKAAPYKSVVRVMTAIQRKGLTKVGLAGG